jgi:hypothetical protein
MWHLLASMRDLNYSLKLEIPKECCPDPHVRETQWAWTENKSSHIIMGQQSQSLSGQGSNTAPCGPNISHTEEKIMLTHVTFCQEKYLRMWGTLIKESLWKGMRKWQTRGDGEREMVSRRLSCTERPQKHPGERVHWKHQDQEATGQGSETVAGLLRSRS